VIELHNSGLGPGILCPKPLGTSAVKQFASANVLHSDEYFDSTAVAGTTTTTS